MKKAPQASADVPKSGVRVSEENAGRRPAPLSSGSEVAAFIAQVKAMSQTEAQTKTVAGRGRLIFAMDATMSRQPTWDMALALQADMFAAVKSIGDLDVKLAYFRGHDECRASRWVSDASALARLMSGVDCRGGFTQIRKILALARREAETACQQGKRIGALVYVGDCMEEDIDHLCSLAGQLGVLGARGFFFQEGHDAAAETAFREMARLTGGAYCRFGRGSADELRELLRAAAMYAAGGRAALADLSRGGDAGRLLLRQLKS
jgi:hypothetical protein